MKKYVIETNNKGLYKELVAHAKNYAYVTGLHYKWGFWLNHWKEK